MAAFYRFLWVRKHTLYSLVLAQGRAVLREGILHGPTLQSSVLLLLKLVTEASIKSCKVNRL